MIRGMRTSLLALIFVISLMNPQAFGNADAPAANATSVKIGNYLVDAPYGIAIIVDDATAFVMDPVWEGPSRKSKYAELDAARFSPGITAPDFSFSQVSFPQREAQVRFTWGRIGTSAVVGMLETDRPVSLTLRFPAKTWPQFHAIYTATADGLTGQGIEPRGRFVPFQFRSDVPPAIVQANTTAEAQIVLALDPKRAIHFAAGVGDLPSLESVESTLKAAGERYESRRASAQGDWGDFVAPIADNVNNTRLYASDNRRIVVGDGRGWWLQHQKFFEGNPDLHPYFVWDMFFQALLANFDDPQTARETIRAVLSFQAPDGRIPSFAHWGAEGDTYETMHRSMPPVGALCLWKMYERRPDRALLEEAYPHLVRWHDWWMKARDGNHNGLLEWGSEQHWWQGAQYETGWDDNVEYIGTLMDGSHMNADAVDLSSLWAMDAEYLARIARALGKPADAAQFETQRKEMNRRINERLWNEDLGIYCSRFWEIPDTAGPELDVANTFKQGFDITFYGDLAQVNRVIKQHANQLALDFDNKSPADGVPVDNWSAHVTGSFEAPESGKYRFVISGEGELRLTLDGKRVENWKYDAQDRRLLDMTLEGGKSYPVALEYFHTSGRAQLQLAVHRLQPAKPGDDWLTRLTPMNFYPLISGAADQERAQKTLAWLYRQDKFWLPALIPSVAKDDPVWKEQTYWHGHVWPPANYLVWLGMQRYADDEHRAEFARRSVNLFMQNWRDNRVNCENYNSTDGTCGDHPHYTWGLLLNLIGMEAMAGVGDDLRPAIRDNPSLNESVVMRRVPFGGNLYKVEAEKGKIMATPETQ